MVALFVINTLVVLQSFFMNVAGPVECILGLMDIFEQEGGAKGAFLCADSSIF